MDKNTDYRQVQLVMTELAESVGLRHGPAAMAAWVTMVGGIVQARVSAMAFEGLGESLTNSGNLEAGRRVACVAEATLRNSKTYAQSTLMQFVVPSEAELSGMEKLTEEAVKRVLALSGL